MKNVKVLDDILMGHFYTRLMVNKKFQAIKQQQEKIFLELSSLMGSMSSPVRLRLIHFLTQAPLTVDVLAAKVNESMANTSMHLRKMLKEKLVRVEVLGQKRLYSLHPAVIDFWENYQDFAQNLDPQLHLKTTEIPDDLNWPQSLEATKKMYLKDEVILLDVRPFDETLKSDRIGKILHIPYSDLNPEVESGFKSAIKKIPRKKKVLVFCRGRLCSLSVLAVRYLREKGINAYRLNSSWNMIKGAFHD